MFAIVYFCLRPCIDGFSVSGNLTLERLTPLSVPLTCWPTPRHQIARSGITLTMGLLTLRYCACAHRHPARFVQQAYACTCQATAAPALTRSPVHVAAVAGCASSSTLSVSASWWGHCRAGMCAPVLPARDGLGGRWGQEEGEGGTRQGRYGGRRRHPRGSHQGAGERLPRRPGHKAAPLPADRDGYELASQHRLVRQQHTAGRIHHGLRFGARHVHLLHGRSDRRIVFTIRCVDDKKMCGANIKAEFECGNFLRAGSKKVQIVGFGGVAQVRDGVDKQVQIFKTVASKPSFLAQQETMVDQTSSTVIDRLKTKISNMPPSSSLVQLQETAAARVPACVVGKDDLRCGMGFPVAKVNGKTFCCGDQRNSAPFIAMINADVSATCPAGTVCKARPVANMACQWGVNDANCAKGMVTHAKYCCPAGATMSFEHTLLDDTQLVTCSIPSNCATKSKAKGKRTSRKVPKRA